MNGLAPYVRILGRGPGRSRNLTAEEAEAALGLTLSGEAAPEAVGALLMLMRFRGETAEEVAGFVRALRVEVEPWSGIGVGLDWPAYASGRSRGLPWFLLSARLVATAGVPVLIHGWSGKMGPASVEGALEAVGIPRVTEAAAAAHALRHRRIAFAPLADLAPRALRVLRLREVLGLRSPVNTGLRLLNPGGAPASVQGVFHPTYRALGRDAALVLGQARFVGIKGGGGEFERHPGKAVLVSGIADSAPFETTAPALVDETRRLADPEARVEDLADLWTGARKDGFAEAVVTGTAALALLAAGVAADLAAAEALAGDLWRRRAG